MDQKIRVHADGEFGALKRQLKGLETDFKRFESVVNRGASKGGLFSTADLKALDLYKRRYQEMDVLVQRSISEQIQKVRLLEQERQKAFGNELKRIEDEIRARRKMISDLRNAQASMAERYGRLSTEAGSYRTEGGALSAFGGLGGLLRGALATLGISTLFGGLMKAYNEAVTREKYISDLGMRIGGARPDFAGLRRGITATGLPYGYTGLESMMAVDNISSRMGVITNRDLGGVQAFTRAFGLDLARTSDIYGRFGQLGVTRRGEMREFAEMIAGAIERGNMTARAAEAMEATANLLEDVAHDQPGNINAGGLLALQTVLNRTGMQGFMGQRGAEFLTQLSSMFKSTDPAVSMFVERALGLGNGRSYYDVMLAKEKGLTSVENLPRVLSAVSQIGGYLSPQLRGQMQDFALAHMTGISLTEAKTLREITNNFSDLSAAKLQAVQNMLSGGVLDQKVGAKNASLGQQTNIADAKLAEALANIGTPLIQPMNDLKNAVTSVLNPIGNAINSIDNLTGWIMALAGIYAATALGRGIGSLRGFRGGKGGGGGIDIDIPGGRAGKGGLGRIGGTILKGLGIAGAVIGGAETGIWLGENVVLPGTEWLNKNVAPYIPGSKANSERLINEQADLLNRANSGNFYIPNTELHAAEPSMWDKLKRWWDGLFDSEEKQEKHYQTSETNQETHYTKSEIAQLESQKKQEENLKAHFGNVESYYKKFADDANSTFKSIRDSFGGLAGYVMGATGFIAGASRTSAGSGIGYNPFSKYAITSYFGDTEGRSSPHKGVDFAIPEGTYLPAMLSGTVKEIGFDMSRGNYIKVATESGDMYTYMHLSGFGKNARPGMRVNAGDIIGISGNTGDSTGPHLHVGYEKWNGAGYTPIDPLTVLGKLPTTAPGAVMAGGGGFSGGYYKVDVNITGAEGHDQASLERIVEAAVKKVFHLDTISQPTKPAGW